MATHLFKVGALATDDMSAVGVYQCTLSESLDYNNVYKGTTPLLAGAGGLVIVKIRIAGNTTNGETALMGIGRATGAVAGTPPAGSNSQPAGYELISETVNTIASVAGTTTLANGYDNLVPIYFPSGEYPTFYAGTAATGTHKVTVWAVQL